jgi:hypothetical protein
MNETLKLPPTIRAYLEYLARHRNRAALERVANAGPGRWTYGTFERRGRRCLLGHAAGFVRLHSICRMTDLGAMDVAAGLPATWAGVGVAFDDLADEYGAELAGKLCANLARALLEGRK